MQRRAVGGRVGGWTAANYEQNWCLALDTHPSIAIKNIATTALIENLRTIKKGTATWQCLA
jgi:hypothetical protein